MKIIELVQGSPDWLNWRKEGLGASDIAAIMGVSKFKTALDVYNSKQIDYVGYVSEAMRYGNEQEPFARTWAESEMECKLYSLCAEDDSWNFLRCSFDAITEDHKLIIEIKSPFNTGNLKNLKEGILPKDYEYQIQWQMMIAEIDTAFIMIWDGARGFWIPKIANKKLHDKMKEAALFFWENLLKGIAPEETHSDISYQHEDLYAKVKAYRDIKANILAETKVAQEMEKEFVELANDKNVILHGLKMTKMPPRVTYDTDQMKLDGIDLSKYEKVGNPYYLKNLMKERSV